MLWQIIINYLNIKENILTFMIPLQCLKFKNGILGIVDGCCPATYG